jgi:hypothetical protein
MFRNHHSNYVARFFILAIWAHKILANKHKKEHKIFQKKLVQTTDLLILMLFTKHFSN